jgi:hypothetical protein
LQSQRFAGATRQGARQEVGMSASVALLWMALASAPADGRVLLCRPALGPGATAASAAAIGDAAAAMPGAFLDYGSACADASEAARAARRAGLERAIFSLVEGSKEASRWVLTLSSAAEEVPLARRELAVPVGADGRPPLRASLADLLGTAPPSEVPPEQRGRVLPWVVTVAGAVALAAGGGLALAARQSASEARGAASPQGYVDARTTWTSRRTAAAAVSGAGAALLAAGLAWRFAF